MEASRVGPGVLRVTPLVVSASILATVSPGLSSIFIFDRSALLRGEVWRLSSCHLVHFGSIHLAYNLLAFGAAGWIIERKGYPRFGWLCLAMAFFVSTALFILKPEMAFYGGLSGMACGSIFYGALMGAGEGGAWRKTCLLVLLFLLLKIGVEMLTADSLLPYWGTAAFVPVPLSHVAGVTAALSSSRSSLPAWIRAPAAPGSRQSR